MKCSRFALARSNFYILSQPQAFVKNFFQDFSIFFEALNKALSRDPPQLSQQPLDCITLNSVCQELFSFLFKLFRPLYALPTHRSAQLVQSTTPSALCQVLFSSFFKLEMAFPNSLRFRYPVGRRFRSNRVILAHPLPSVKTHFSELFSDL